MGPTQAPTPSSNPAPEAATATMEGGRLVVQKGEQRIVFRADKEILLPAQSSGIRNAICTDPDTSLFNPHTVTIGPSGYSSLKPFILSGDLRPGEYEAACSAVLQRFVSGFNAAMRGYGWNVPSVITHGASDVGVDKAARESALAASVRQFGFNQPEWMPYVPDDKVPVYVGANKDDYHHKFAAHTMILVLLGGRDDAAYHDRLNVQRYRNLVLPCPIMPFLTNNAPPAWDPKYDLERVGADPVEWASTVPILDASLAHLRSSPLPVVEGILAGEKTPERLNELVDYLVTLAVKHVGERFPQLERPIDLSDHRIGGKPSN